MACLSLERASNCTKNIVFEDVPKYCCVGRSLVSSDGMEFLPYHIRFPSGSLQWRRPRVFLSWGFLLLELINFLSWNSTHSRSQRGRCTRWILSVTVRCLSMQDQQHYLLNVLDMLEGTGIDWNSLVSRNIKIFSSLLFLLPQLISNLQITIAKHRRTSPSCTLRWCHCSRLLRRFLEELVDHIVAIGWWLLTRQKPFDHSIVVFQCQSIFFKTGIETEVNVTVDFCLDKQRWKLNFDSVSIIMVANFYVQDWTDSRILEKSSSYTSLLFISRHRVFSA